MYVSQVPQHVSADRAHDLSEVVVVPIIAESGPRLLGGTATHGRLRLEQVERSSSGCVFLTYGRA